jgi:hypothetical protein
LGDARVVDYLNDNFVCTYLKVAKFEIINNQKVGGNVASYFCLADASASVVHAVPGQSNPDKMLSEARWAYETRKTALTFGTVLGTDKVDMRKYYDRVKQAHLERYNNEAGGMWHLKANGGHQLPANMPRNLSQQGQVHYLLAKEPLAKLDLLYPIVWTQVLGEQLSTLPVGKR